MDGMQHDIEIIRPAMRDADVRSRAGSAPPADLKLIRKGLLTLHTLELMAVNIYQCQITPRSTELNRRAHRRHVQRDDAPAGFPGEALRIRMAPEPAPVGVLDRRVVLRHVLAPLGREGDSEDGRLGGDEGGASLCGASRRQSRGTTIRARSSRRTRPTSYGHVERWKSFLE